MHDKVLMKLEHKPEPGYPTAFWVTLGVAVAYLITIFVLTAS